MIDPFVRSSKRMDATVTNPNRMGSTTKTNAPRAIILVFIRTAKLARCDARGQFAYDPRRLVRRDHTLRLCDERHRARALGEQLGHEAICLRDAFDLDRGGVDGELDAMESLLQLVGRDRHFPLVFELEHATVEEKGCEYDDGTAHQRERPDKHGLRHCAPPQNVSNDRP